MTLPLSDHFNGKTFFQKGDGARGWLDFWRWRFTAKPKPWPRRDAPRPTSPPPNPHGDEVVVTWIGHASFLLQSARLNLLIDPVFSERASPFKWIGPRRVQPPGIAPAALPRIDAILLSHDHYDHCDTASLRQLSAAHRPQFIAPLRHRDILAAAGAERIIELDWWQTHAFGPDALVRLTPTRHWSKRLGTPRNYRLWGGFYLTLGSRRIWFVGDTGYDERMFREIRARCGAPHLALVPIGAYEPRWFMSPMHVNPAEAVQLHQAVAPARSVGMHWGTFQLSDEGRDDPVRDLVEARTGARINEDEFRILSAGESLVV